MKKVSFLLILSLALLLASLFFAPALAETYVLDPIYATVDIPEGYVVLTPENLGSYATWLSAKGKTQEETEADFEKRGVLLQAWDSENGRVFELRATQDQETLSIFDINEQDTDYRGSYRTKHFPKNEISGYEFTSADWKSQDGCRFLVVKYKRRDSGEILYRGFMRRTICNGYQIDLDMQIADRATTAKDNSVLNQIWESFHFVEVKSLPPTASAKIKFTSEPPEETSKSNFNIAGTAAEGVSITSVTMGLNYPDPIVSEVLVGKDGKFSIPITIPKEGVFLITLTAEYQDEIVLEASYPVTYQHNLLYVNFTTEPESVTNEETIKIAGRSEAGAAIQILINGEKIATKHVNSQGKFAVELDLDEEETYEISLVFSKKGLADRRFTYTVKREFTDAETIKALKKQSIAPSYSKLCSNIDKYTGKILGYKAYIVDIAESGDEVIITMALNKKNKKYSNYLLVTSSEQPNFKIDEKVYVYGSCTGLSQSGESSEEESSIGSCPCMSLLLFADIN